MKKYVMYTLALVLGMAPVGVHSMPQDAVGGVLARARGASCRVLVHSGRAVVHGGYQAGSYICSRVSPYSWGIVKAAGIALTVWEAYYLLKMIYTLRRIEQRLDGKTVLGRDLSSKPLWCYEVGDAVDKAKQHGDIAPYSTFRVTWQKCKAELALYGSFLMGGDDLFSEVATIVRNYTVLYPLKSWVRSICEKIKEKNKRMGEISRALADAPHAIRIIT